MKIKLEFRLGNERGPGSYIALTTELTPEQTSPGGIAWILSADGFEGRGESQPEAAMDWISNRLQIRQMREGN